MTEQQINRILAHVDAINAEREPANAYRDRQRNFSVNSAHYHSLAGWAVEHETALHAAVEAMARMIRIDMS